MASFLGCRKLSKVIRLFAAFMMFVAALYSSISIGQLLSKPASHISLTPPGILKTTLKESVMTVRPRSNQLVHGNISLISPYLYKMAKPGLFESLPKQFLKGYKSPCWIFKTKRKEEELLCLPYFYIIGMMKCGTTELWAKVKKHPHVYSDVGKEPHWWPSSKSKHVSFESYLSGRSTKMARLLKEKEGLQTRLITGDASPSTIWDNENWLEIFGDIAEGPEFVTADLLRAVQPNAKLIITLREPTSRLYSHYLHYHPKSTPDKFHQSAVETIASFRDCRKNMTIRACTYTTSIMNDVKILLGLYVVYVQDWLRAFPRGQIYIQRLEDWQGHCPELLPKLYTFLELEALSDQNITEICGQSPQNGRKSRLRAVGDMHDKTRKLLRDFYAESNRRLSEILDDDRYLWNEIIGR